MTALARANVVGALLLLGAAGGAIAHARYAPKPQPPEACAINDLTAACDDSCNPLRGRWTAGAAGGVVMLKCTCEEPPNIGERPKVRKAKKPEVKKEITR